MTPVQITNGAAAANQLEAATRQSAYEMTYFHDAPRAIGMANDAGSYLITGAANQDDTDVLLADLRHVAENMYSNSTTVIDAQPGGMTEAEVRKAFRVAEATSVLGRNLLVITNLDLLIGSGRHEPTKLQQFAITSLMKWTTDDESFSRTAKRHICAIMSRPDLAAHPLRAELLSSFAGKHSLIGSVHSLDSEPQEEPRRITTVPVVPAAVAA